METWPLPIPSPTVPPTVPTTVPQATTEIDGFIKYAVTLLEKKILPELLAACHAGDCRYVCSTADNGIISILRYAT